MVKSQKVFFYSSCLITLILSMFVVLMRDFSSVAYFSESVLGEWVLIFWLPVLAVFDLVLVRKFSSKKNISDKSKAILFISFVLIMLIITGIAYLM